MKYELIKEEFIEIKKEKIIKNGSKNSVIVNAINQDKEYMITF